jgi:hypothetical protein
MKWGSRKIAEDTYEVNALIPTSEWIITGVPESGKMYNLDKFYQGFIQYQNSLRFTGKLSDPQGIEQLGEYCKENVASLGRGLERKLKLLHPDLHLRFLVSNDYTNVELKSVKIVGPLVAADGTTALMELELNEKQTYMILNQSVGYVETY